MRLKLEPAHVCSCNSPEGNRFLQMGSDSGDFFRNFFEKNLRRIARNPDLRRTHLHEENISRPGQGGVLSCVFCLFPVQVTVSKP